jgi:RNA polymerase sigma-70 factor (ECF subfamily)
MDHDGALLQACLRGEEPARNEFVARFAPVIHGAVRRTLGGKPRDPSLDEEDVSQEVFLRLFKDGCRLLGTYDPARASLASWLFLVARSTAIDLVRRKRPVTVPFEGNLHDPVQEPPKASGERIEIPPDLLSTQQRLVMHLLFERGWDVREVARLMGVTEQTVRSMKHKALEKLRMVLRKETAQME